MRRRRSSARFFVPLLIVLLVLLAVPAAGQETSPAPDLSDLPWRNIGPAVTGGRIVDFAVVETHPDVFYVATASGGAWKTVNGGDTWEPVFDSQARVSIGGIAVAQSDPHTIWIGTGEPNARNLRSSSWGDGVYRSRDGGRSWTHMGLEASQHIGRVAIDPRNAKIVFVSVLGSMWTGDPERDAARGLWRTRDGGETWEKVLDAGDRAGVVEVAIDRSRPDRLYAATWERQRTDWSFRGRGPGSALYASRDGGDSWSRLGNGLPDVDLGRSGLSVCRSQPDTVYAVLDAADGKGGLYRSDDGGASWQQRSAEVSSSMYYGQVRCDPADPDRVYVLGTRMWISTDGGLTFSTGVPGATVHVDHHALWIDPGDPDRQLLGNDGGVYLSRDRGRSWRFAANLPITQFYTVAVDDRQPFYRVYGGTQDNNSLGGPSGTRNDAGVVNSDWYLTVGGDGFFVQTDPEDPDVVYTESQYGNLVRFDATTGDRKPISPQAAAGEHYRWNWSAPVLVSAQRPGRVYFGAQYLFRSDDRGNRWDRISPDLTRAIEVDPETAISDYGTLRVIAESSLDDDLLAVGTDDGLVQVTEDGGATWRRAVPLPGVPETWQIVRVVLSSHDRSTLYVAASGHEFDDFHPYLLRSRDLGDSWQRIDGGLPEDGPVRALAEHPRVAGLLFVGTEFGVRVSLDDGASWLSLRNGMPTVPVHDLLIHPRTGDLVAATHGRGLWILDSTAGIAALASAPDRGRPQLAVRGPAYRLVTFDRGKGDQGDTFFTAPSPPRGALLDVWLPPEAEEARLVIRDASGAPVRTLATRARGGALNRVVWDLRVDPLYVSAGEDFGRDVPGPRVVPGEYVAVLQAAGVAIERSIEVRPDPEAGVSSADSERQFAAARAAGEALGRAQAAAGTLTGLRRDLDAATAAASRADAGEIGERLESLSREGEALWATLREGQEADDRPVVPTLSRLTRQIDASPAAPTADEMRLLSDAQAALQDAIRSLEQLQEAFTQVAARMDAAGIPWSPGRRVGARDQRPLSGG